MGGPVFSIRFLDRFSITSHAAFGKYSAQSKGITPTAALVVPAGIIQAANFFKKYSRNIFKWGNDNILGFKLNRYFSLFTGIKAQGYVYSENMKYLIANGNMGTTDLENNVSLFGPGFGLGVTVPVVTGSNVQMNLSAIILFGNEKINVTEAYYLKASAPNFVPLYHFFPHGHFMAYGGNASENFNKTIKEKITPKSFHTHRPTGRRFSQNS